MLLKILCRIVFRYPQTRILFDINEGQEKPQIKNLTILFHMSRLTKSVKRNAPIFQRIVNSVSGENIYIYRKKGESRFAWTNE